MISFWHILVVLVIILIVFGAGKLPRVMGEMGKGIRSFKDGLEGKDKDDGEQKKLPEDKP